MKQEARVYHQVIVTIVTKQWQLQHLSPSCASYFLQTHVQIKFCRFSSAYTKCLNDSPALFTWCSLRAAPVETHSVSAKDDSHWRLDPPNAVPSHSLSLSLFISPAFGHFMQPLFFFHFLCLTPSPVTVCLSPWGYAVSEHFSTEDSWILAQLQQHTVRGCSTPLSCSQQLGLCLNVESEEQKYVTHSKPPHKT